MGGVGWGGRGDGLEPTTSEIRMKKDYVIMKAPFQIVKLLSIFFSLF